MDVYVSDDRVAHVLRAGSVSLLTDLVRRVDGQAMVRQLAKKWPALPTIERFLAAPRYFQ